MKIPKVADRTAVLVVNEIFGPTLQGEGPSAGQPAMFVRLYGCSLSCRWCDTAWTWDPTRFNLETEQHPMTVNAVLQELRAQIPGLVVITGGEPLLQQDGLITLAEGISTSGIAKRVEVETSGTVRPSPALTAAVAGFNVSPKLAHSGLSRPQRIRPEVLRQFVASGKADTLLLLAIKMYDYETSIPRLANGQVVIEGRSLYTTAAYQSIILCPSDAEALAQAREILEMASEWRPLPDLTILVADDPAAAVDRAERRDDRTVSGEERRIHYRAAALYEHLAAEDPVRIHVLDRRMQNNPAALNSMQDWISQARDRIGCLPEPWAMCRSCTGSCRLRGTSAATATPATSPGG